MKWGIFPEPPKLEFPEDGKTCIVLEDFLYIRWDKREMVAKAGLRCDGASIPRFLWVVADSPFTGNNLYPALIHDQYCKYGRDEKSPYSSDEVHYVFHQGLRAMGENVVSARLKWVAVRTFGPRFKANV